MEQVRRHKARRESGQALVEMALVLPVLVALIFGIVDLSKAYNYWNDTQQLANMGARYAAVGQNPTSVPGQSLSEYIRQQADTSELKNGVSSGSGSQGSLKVCITADSGPQVGKPVKVVVRSDYKFMSIPGLGGITRPMSGTATMRLEAIPPAGMLTAACP